LELGGDKKNVHEILWREFWKILWMLKVVYFQDFKGA
jgi:hypothetical protein